MEFSIYQFSTDAAFEAFDDGALILNLNDVTFTELNSTAQFIIQATDGKRSINQVAKMFAEEYEIDLIIAVADVTELYMDLKKHGIIEPVKTNEIEEE